MDAPLGLQFSIAVCIAMVAATFAPSVRRSIPRWFEIALWVALVIVCWLGIASIRDPHARELTSAVNWAAGQTLNTLLGLIGANVVSMLASVRFVIANVVVIVFGADLLALALVRSYRQGRTWQPQVLLRDWMELPAAPVPAPAAPQAVPYAVDKLSESWAAATAVAGAAAATWSVHLLIWARDIGLPRAEERLSAVLNGMAESQQRIAPAAGGLAQVVDIQALRIGQSLGRLGRPMSTEEKVEENGPDQTDRLAS